MKRRRIISIICAVLLAISMVGSITAYALGNEYKYVTVTTCYVRSTPSIDGSVLATLSPGTHKQDYYQHIAADYWSYSVSSWAPVSQGNCCGFIRSDLVCPLDRAYYVNTSSGLNLRQSSSSSSPSIGILPYNTVVSWLGTHLDDGTYDWYKVVVMTGTYEGSTGWVAFSYLSTYAH